MANEATILRIRAQVENLEGLNRARSAVRNFATESKAASNDLDKLRSMFKELGSESIRSVNNLKNYRTGLDALRQSAEIGSTTFKELTSEIRQLDNELGSLQGKQTQVAQEFNKITTATNAAIAAQRTYSGLIRNPLTGGYSMPPVQTPMGGRLLPAAQGFDFTAQDSRIQAQAAEASAQSARDARRRAKMQELSNYSGTTIGARDPNTGALIAGGSGPFQNVGTQYNRPAGPQPAPVRSRANLGRLGPTAGAIAAAGVFGGPEGLIGAGIGAFGGPGGALAGGAMGAQVNIIRQQLSGVANYTKELNLAKITLAQASTGQEDYNKNLRIARQISTDYTVGLKETIQGYSQVSVAAKANGLTLKDTENIYRGVVAAGTAFGKSQEDLDAIVRATVQVLSKGKLSAEELQGQIGERLPGAVAKFAEATGRSLPQLAKDLEDGKVNIADFVKFTEKQVQNYDEIAKIIGASPEKAGERLKLALDTASENYGGFFLKISVMFSDSMTKLVSWFNQNSEIIQRVVYLYYRYTKAISDFVQVPYQAIRAAGKSLREYFSSLFPAFDKIIKMSEIAAKMQGKKIFKSATDNYKDLFPEFNPSANMFGKDSKQARVGDTVGGDAEKPNKAAENAAKRLADRIKEQLANADKLFSLETARLDITLAATKQEELEAKYNKVIVERREKYLSLQKNAVSEQERMRIAEAQSVAIIADHQTYLGEINKLMQEQTKELYAQVGLSATLNKNLQAAFAGAFTGGTATGTFRTDVDLMPGLTGGKLGSKMEELKKSLADLQDPINQVLAGAQAIGEAFSTSFKGLIDGSMSAQQALAGFFKNIANYFLDMASQMIAKYIQMQIIGLAQKLLPGMFGGIFGASGPPDLSGSAISVPNQYSYGLGPNILASANGNVFAQNGIIRYAKGGIVDRPMVFPFAKGIGLMGEAGPEAIMPLRRGRDGNLGVMSSGGGTTNVVVNVDASGSSVEGNQSQAKALGNAISVAVQSELVKQKRPGGLLA